MHLIAELVDIGEQGASVDTSFADKQPDWTYDEVDSGKTPVERFTDHRATTRGLRATVRPRDPDG